MQLDKPAAGRFIKHALSGNDAYDEERAQKKPALETNKLSETENAKVSEFLKQLKTGPAANGDQNFSVKPATTAAVDNADNSVKLDTPSTEEQSDNGGAVLSVDDKQKLTSKQARRELASAKKIQNTQKKAKKLEIQNQKNQNA